MPEKKTLTLGITVNLDNYENLRLEITGEVGSPEDADELAGFLDTMLSRLGRGDEATAERVDNYRKRVFSMKEAEKISETGVQTVLTSAGAETPLRPVATPGPAPAGVRDAPEIARAAEEPEHMTTPGPAPVSVKDAPETARTTAEPEHMTTPGPAPATAMAKPPASHVPETPVKKAPEPVQPAAPTADLCEECGAAMTKTQKQMSQLFLNRTLCKACMDRLTHPR